jgi:hypothetical protein
MRCILRSTIPTLALAAATGLALPGPSAAVPERFIVEDAFPSATFDIPVQVVFLPDGRTLVVGLRGIVWVVLADRTQLPTPFLDIRDEVERQGDLGLLSGLLRAARSGGTVDHPQGRTRGLT